MSEASETMQYPKERITKNPHSSSRRPSRIDSAQQNFQRFDSIIKGDQSQDIMHMHTTKTQNINALLPAAVTNNQDSSANESTTTPHFIKKLGNLYQDSEQK